MSAGKLVVGQRLWHVPNRQGGGCAGFVEITKVGRKWAGINHVHNGEVSSWNFGRIDMETMLVDGGQYCSPAACYLSKEEYEHMVFVGEKYDKIYRFFNHRHIKPDSLDEAAVDKILEIIGAENEQRT